MSWSVTVVLLSLLLLILLVWQEVKRLNRPRLTARIIASLVAVASMACLALPLMIQKPKTKDAGTIILLTSGFDRDSVRGFLQQENNQSIFTFDRTITSFDAMYLPAPDTIIASQKTTHVFGDGLTQNELASLHDLPLVYHAGNDRHSRISTARWTQTVATGQPLRVQGQYYNSSSTPVTLVLSAFNTTVDSTVLTEKGDQDFQLSCTPKHVGRAVYALLVLSGKDTLENDPVPVDVRTPVPLSILVLASSPDFENKFLKNWLTENQYRFAVRTAISTNKFEKQFVNLQPLPVETLGSALLEKFDLVIADASQLSSMPATNLNALKNAIGEMGLGLIVRSDTAGGTSAFYSASFPLVQLRDSIRRSASLRLSEQERPLSPLHIDQPVFIRESPEAKILVRDQQMHSLAAGKLFGSGKIVFSTISNTYSWKLAGIDNDYDAYWSFLIRNAAKKIVTKSSWRITPAFPRINEETELALRSGEDRIPEIRVGESRLYPQQEAEFPYQWKARYWPVRQGWQPVLANGVSSFIYVYSQSDWPGIKAAGTLQATKEYELTKGVSSSPSAVVDTRETEPVPKIYFFLAFLFSAGFLWFEKKFLGGDS